MNRALQLARIDLATLTLLKQRFDITGSDTDNETYTDLLYVVSSYVRKAHLAGLSIEAFDAMYDTLLGNPDTGVMKYRKSSGFDVLYQFIENRINL